MPLRPTILTIAGSDSSGGAGIQADLKAIAANGGYGASVVTAVTAQNTRGVVRADPLPVDLVEAQLRAVGSDLEIAAVKTGMLATAEIVRGVARVLRELRVGPLVCDPVMVSKSGHPLLARDAADALVQEIFPRAVLVTPNVHEAGALTGVEIDSERRAEEAGRLLLARGARAVLVKGGHLEASPATDLLVTAEGTRRFAGSFVPSPHTHGTGCTYSAAIATHLGRGLPLVDAIAVAKEFVTEAIRAGLPIGEGISPTDPFFFLRSETDGARWIARIHGTGGAARRVPILHVITDETIQDRFSHEELALLAARGGADAVQLREKRARTTVELVAGARRMDEALRGSGVTIVVNDRVDVAAGAGIAAVHLGRDDLDASVARRLLGPDALVGRTANSLEEATGADLAEVDYLGVGPVFGTRTKANPAPPLGLDALRRIASSVGKPVVAIGSITPERVAAVLATGVHGIAVASAVVCASDPAAETRRFREAIDACRAARVAS